MEVWIKSSECGYNKQNIFVCLLLLWKDSLSQLPLSSNVMKHKVIGGKLDYSHGDFKQEGA